MLWKPAGLTPATRRRFSDYVEARVLSGLVSGRTGLQVSGQREVEEWELWHNNCRPFENLGKVAKVVH